MPGILSDPRGDIQKIRELLKEYDPGFAFLKELVQNADDGGATTLRLAWLPGSPDPQHPLLGAPALIALNNGRFTEGDRDGLMRMGLGNKGGDIGKIGKFGLGTKSIFHVAEAFFFLDSTGDPELRSILNPWSPHRHKDWDHVEDADWDYLDANCRALAKGLASWFSIWIPLRRHEDLGSTAAIMTGDHAFPGEHDSCPKDLRAPFLSQRPMLGELLALLRHLDTVEFHSPKDDPLVIRLSRNGEPSFSIQQPERKVAGRIRSHREEGREEPWRNRQDWPQVIDTLEDGEEESSPDKAEWNHAIVLTSSPARSAARLRIYWSVFLPVGNKPYFETTLDGGSRDLSLFLHGFFFLNSSRTQLDGLDGAFDSSGRSGPAAVCREWNRALACEPGGLLPALLPSMAAWLDEGHILPEEMPTLTRALHASPLSSWFHNDLTRDGSLAFCLDNGSWAWRWIPADKPAAVVPKIDTPERLKILERITTSPDADGRFVFVVDLPSIRALTGPLQEFDRQCLEQLRQLVGNQDLNDEEADLIRGILNTVSTEHGLPESWKNVPLYPVLLQGRGRRVRKTADELQAWGETGDLFSDDPNKWAKSLGEAASSPDVPVIAASPLPADIHAPNLTGEKAVSWLLARPTLAADPKDRLPIFKHLATRERFSETDLRALRYLAHAKPESRDDSDSELYFRVGSQTEWAKVFEAALDGDARRWRLIDSRFSDPVSTALKPRIRINACNAESWEPLVRSFGEHACDLDFSDLPPDLLAWILTHTPEDDLDCLKHLRIHRLGDSEMVSATDESIWLDEGLHVPEELESTWRELRQQARILKAHGNETNRLRQRKLFDPRVLDASGALELAAKAPEPVQYRELILYLLSYGGTPRAHAIDALRDSLWLTLEAGTQISPARVLHLEKLEHELKAMLAHLPACRYHSSTDLDSEIRESRGWRTLVSQVLPSEAQVFEILHDLLDPVPQSLALGFHVEEEATLEDWLHVVQLCPDPSPFPSRAFLAGLAGHEKLRERALPLAIALSAPFEGQSAAERYRTCIEALQLAHESSTRDQQSRIIQVITYYLTGAKVGGVWDNLKTLDGLCLPNTGGRWKPATELAPPCAGIQPKVLLHPKLAEALGLDGPRHQIPEQQEDQDLQEDAVSAEESARNLDMLLTPFRERLEAKAVAILPALLGKDPETQVLAERMLEGIQPSSIRDELIPDDVEVNDQVGGLLRERADEWTFRVIMLEGSVVELISIAETTFRAPVLDTTETVFLPHPNGQMHRWAGGGLQILCVSEPSRFENLSDAELREVLVRSIRELLWWVYVHKPRNLEEVIEKYTSLGQMSLGVARQEILRSVDTQLQILGVLPPALEHARRLSNEARTRLAEADAGIGNVERVRREGTKAEEQARSLFLEKLDRDPEVHDCLLSGVRRRISQQQYEPDSVPFEIFQNADDAAVELLEHSDLPEEARELARRFYLEIEGDALLFHYGGRPINSACGLVGPKGDRFRRDLVKMLLLSGSDKNASELESVTGRFGLGFKSVFLLSDRPCVSSGALAFDIAGAIWPRPLAPEILEQLSEAGEAHFPSYRQRTTILLPSTQAKIAEACERFLALAPWMPVFAKQLSCIEVHDTKPSTVYRWEPEPLDGQTNASMGTIGGRDGAIHQLEFRDGTIQWLFRVENGKLSHLPDFVPWLWVTAPTREEALGFALNGPFALDPGRTRLSKQHDDVSRTNRDFFQHAASLFRSEFEHLAANPQALDQLGVADPYHFWLGLWKLMIGVPMVARDPEGAEHLAVALWPHNGASGYVALIGRHEVLPNGLTGDLRKLVRTSSISHSIQGWLGSGPGSRFLADAMSLEICPFDAANCCSETVAAELRRRIKLEIGSFGLSELLGGEGGHTARIAAQLAGLAGEALWPELASPFDANFETVLKPDETSQLKGLATTVSFLAEDGSWQHPEQLLLCSHHLPTSSNSDEQRRSRFAPTDRILSSSYTPAAAKLFVAFRPRFQAEAVEMAEWVRDLDSGERFVGVLQYLASGELRQQLAFELGKGWLEVACNSAEFRELEPQVQHAILFVFDIARIENERRRSLGEPCRPEEESDPEPQMPLPLPPITLEEIYEAWDPEAAIREFTVAGPLGHLITPVQPDRSHIATRLLEPSTLPGKAAWYRLLCLGCSFGIPLGNQPRNRVQRFWEERLRERFWESTIPPDLEDAESTDFNRNLDSYFDEIIHMLFKDANATGEEARFWRRVFYDFRKMHSLVFHNHLPETIADLAAFPEANGLAFIGFLRNGRIPDVLQDGHSRWSGVIGQSMTAPLLFVMRELRLLGVLPDDRFDSACYYMNTPARRVARSLGWITDAFTGDYDFSKIVQVSETVHARMREEAPELAEFLDLPLQWYALQNPS